MTILATAAVDSLIGGMEASLSRAQSRTSRQCNAQYPCRILHEERCHNAAGRDTTQKPPGAIDVLLSVPGETQAMCLARHRQSLRRILPGPAHQHQVPTQIAPDLAPCRKPSLPPDSDGPSAVCHS